MSTVEVTTASGAVVEVPDSLAPEVLRQIGRVVEAPPGATGRDGRTVPVIGRFEPGDTVVPPTADEIRAELPTHDEALTAVAGLFEALSECSERVRVLTEMRDRGKEQRFGQSSQRHAGGTGGSGDSGGAGTGGNVGAGGTEEVGADGGENNIVANGGGDANAGAGAGDPGGTAPDPTGDGGDGKKAEEKDRPRRSKGCAEAVTRDAIPVRLRREIDEATLERLRAEGHDVRRLSDGTYSYVTMLTVALDVTVTYERALVDGEVMRADSAEGSKLLRNSPYGADVLAELVLDRFALAMTGPRIAQRAAYAGLGITTQTIYRLTTQYALSIALPIVARLLQVAVSSEALQSDETWVRVRESLARENRRNSVMWMVRTSEALGIPPVVVLSFTGSRAASCLARLLRGFAGSLMADGYSGYPAALRELADAVEAADADEAERALELAGCLQHARSKFVDALKALDGSGKGPADARRAELPASRLVNAFAGVFLAERGCEGKDREERKRVRAEEVRPELDKVFGLVDEYLATPLGKLDDYLGRALRYADANREKLYAAVDNPDMPLTNSACEREFAHLGTIRANSRQFDTVMGAHTLALWFSVVRTAALNEADEATYLRFLFETAPALMKSKGDWVWHGVPKEGWASVDPSKLKLPEDLGYLDELMPWGERYAKYAASDRERRRDEFVGFARLVAEGAA